MSLYSKSDVEYVELRRLVIDLIISVVLSLTVMLRPSFCHVTSVGGTPVVVQDRVGAEFKADVFCCSVIAVIL